MSIFGEMFLGRWQDFFSEVSRKTSEKVDFVIAGEGRHLL
jgi:hypothetical protein